MKICLKMTGCKNNRYELDQVILWCAQNGAELVTDDREADFCVINTCTVTHVADKKSRQLIRKTKNANPNLKTIVFGCAARMQKEGFKKIKETDYLLGDLSDVIAFLQKKLKKIEKKEVKTDLPSRARALVQIQDGCENFCTYCIIARARGRSKNRPANDIIDEISRHSKNGFNEVVLTGINIGAYGASKTTKPDESRLAELLTDILNRTTIQRIRLSSLGPQYFNDELFTVLKNPRLCRHIHLSIQSGSDTVLKRMNRYYTVADAEGVIQRLKRDIPGIAITTDIIVGFPEETDTEFKETLDFVKRNPLAKIHVFPYSIRPDTLAAAMKQIPDNVKKERVKKLQSLAGKQRREFIEDQLGKTVSVLWEKENEGLTDHYIRVKGKGVVRSVTTVKLMKKNIIDCRLS
ncbi:tRNA (N(6)-L-threonylcarbamoyladenosine(37)-C(2))-methylthiotransferase MtaB [Candidatus Peregrinibacteria bacterium]|nr:tRNA (N(6)-L-threonylcarbamoyladenosine(37)-C(2))-methylthiotransferase MtaB [Candidatus Peregrinibacteria bacterium]